VIPCCADLDFFNYKNIEPHNNFNWRKQLQISADAYVVSYLGSVGTWYMPNEMFDFFKVLLKHKPDSIFLFISKDNPNYILKLAEQRGLSSAKIRIQAAERNQVPGLLSVSDAALFFIKPVWSKKASSPTKMAEIMGLGIPIVANSKVGDVDLVMQKNPSGILVESFTKNDYQLAVNQLLQLQAINKTEVHDLACEYFSLAKGISIFDTIYQKLH
jgi:glycosyltransferase involved in cell wall biosynthesis